MKWITGIMIGSGCGFVNYGLFHNTPLAVGLAILAGSVPVIVVNWANWIGDD